VAEAVSGSDSSFSWPSRLSTFFSTAFLFFVFFMFFLLVDIDAGRTNSWPAWVVVGSSTSIITSFMFYAVDQRNGEGEFWAHIGRDIGAGDWAMLALSAT
jgi:hypothetical protein